MYLSPKDPGVVWQASANWDQGKTIEHEASNPSGRLRVVFIFDVWHPGLTPTERDAVRQVIASEGGVDNAL